MKLSFARKSTNENLPSERHFGYLFVAVLLILGMYSLYKGYESQIISIYVGLAFLLGLICWLKPILLRPLNLAWYKLGHLMGLVVTPLVLGVIFYGLITPIAFLSRLFGRDMLNMKKNAQVSSYWVDRNHEQLKPESFKKQF